MSMRADLAINAGAGTGAAQEWLGGAGYFAATAAWGGGSAKLQMQLPNNEWIDVPSVSLTANGCIAINLPKGKIRTVIATSTAAYVYAIKN